MNKFKDHWPNILLHLTSAIVVAIGMGIWFRGGGAFVLISGSAAIGLFMLVRVLRFHDAVAILAVWTLLSWLLVGVLVQAYLAQTEAGSYVLLFGAVTPLLIGYVSRLPVCNNGENAKSRSSAGGSVFVASALAGSVLIIGSAVAALHYFGVDGVAWTLAGDARNQLSDYAEAMRIAGTSPGVAGVISPRSTLFSAVEVAGSGPGQSAVQSATGILNAMKGLWFVTVMAACLCSLSSASLLSAACGSGSRRVSMAVLTASLLPLSGIGIGVAVLEGFSTALLAAPLLTLAVVMAMSLSSGSASPGLRLVLLSTIAGAAVLVLFLWSFIALPVVVILLFGLAISWARLAPKLRIVLVATAIALALFVAPTLLKWARDIQNVNALAAGGSIPYMPVQLLVMQPILALATVLGLGTNTAIRRLVPYLVASAAVFVTVALIVSLPPGNATWSYYGSKAAWIWALATIGLVALPIARMSGALDDSREIPNAQSNLTRGFDVVSLRRVSARVVGLALAAAGTLLVVQQLSPVLSPFFQVNSLPLTAITPVRSGYFSPSPDALRTVRSETQTEVPIVIWRVTDPVNDRYANFLVDLYAPHTSPVFRDWAYRMTPEIQSLCALLAVEPERTVVTRLPSLEADIVFHCGIDNPRVRLIS
jgi:hypothetical protein